MCSKFENCCSLFLQFYVVSPSFAYTSHSFEPPLKSKHPSPRHSWTYNPHIHIYKYFPIFKCAKAHVSQKSKHRAKVFNVHNEKFRQWRHLTQCFHSTIDIDWPSPATFGCFKLKRKQYINDSIFSEIVPTLKSKVTHSAHGTK